MSAFVDYVNALTDRAEQLAGQPLRGRTVVVADPDRVGRRSATAYPMPTGTIVWCDPDLVAIVQGVLGDAADSAITADEWVDVATAAGAEHLGSGSNRVLVGEVRVPPMPEGLSARRLDRDVPGDVATLARFVEACSADDLDEAQVDLDDLDPFIVGLFDGETDDETMVAYASGLPDDDMGGLDDIGVVTHPDHRRRGYGSIVVGQYVERRLEQAPEARMLYRCNRENVGSNGVAESLGFTPVHTIGAVRFPE